MSLQVWLPLNGDLHNQGLADITVINNGATVNNNGKIGKCYSFDGSDDFISLNNQKLCDIFKGGTQQFSIAFWIYHADATRAVIFGDYGLTGSINFNIELTTSHAVRFYWANTPDKKFDSTSYVTASAWTHICLTYDSSKVQIYRNGILSIDIYNGTLVEKNKTSGIFYLGRDSRTGTTALNGKLNDFRIYDHALSQKEVEELAKGLILHYKLDDLYVENSNIINSIINDTAYNSSIKKYGYNETSNLGKINGNFHGKDCVKIYTLTEGQTAQPYTYFSNLFTSNGTNAPAYKALSFDYFTTVPTTTWLNVYKLGSGSGIATWKTINSNGTFTGTYTNSSNSITVKPNEWNHIEIVFHGTTDANAEWGYCINGPAHTTNSQYYFLYANIQVEENDHATGYGNNFHDNIVHDSSGYNNNGQSNQIVIKNSGPRYNINSIFNGTNSYIKVIENKWMPQHTRELTINLWAKATTWPTSGHIFSCTESGGFNTEKGNSGYWRFPVYVCTNEAQTSYAYKYDSQEIQLSALPMNEWVMLTFVYDSTGTRTYINGQLHHTYINTSYGIHFNTNARLFLGCEANTASPSSPYFNGEESDFRIYATALTPEQILELYHTSATIDNIGSVYGREIIEDINVSITKQGQLKTNSIVEQENTQTSIIKTTNNINSYNFYEY